jgi:hypothetical protein
VAGLGCGRSGAGWRDCRAAAGARTGCRGGSVARPGPQRPDSVATGPRRDRTPPRPDPAATGPRRDRTPDVHPGNQRDVVTSPTAQSRPECAAHGTRWTRFLLSGPIRDPNLVPFVLHVNIRARKRASEGSITGGRTPRRPQATLTAAIRPCPPGAGTVPSAGRDGRAQQVRDAAERPRLTGRGARVVEEEGPWTRRVS